MEQSQKPLEKPCGCGSGKQAGSCCMSGQKCDKCFPPSEKPAGECCYKQQ